jgi:hypothetical protein
MDETSDQIERRIQETRSDLSDNFSELEEKVRTAFDWRAQFEEHPAAMVGAAFGAGILLSALLPIPRRRLPRRWDSVQDSDTRIDSIVSPSPLGENQIRASETLNALKGALMGVAATKLSGYIEQMLPGFRQEFDKARNVDGAAPSNPSRPAWQKSAAAGAD